MRACRQPRSARRPRAAPAHGIALRRLGDPGSPFQDDLREVRGAQARGRDGLTDGGGHTVTAALAGRREARSVAQDPADARRPVGCGRVIGLEDHERRRATHRRLARGQAAVCQPALERRAGRIHATRDHDAGTAAGDQIGRVADREQARRGARSERDRGPPEAIADPHLAGRSVGTKS